MVVAQILGSNFLESVGFDLFIENLKRDVQIKIFPGKYINQFRYLSTEFCKHDSFVFFAILSSQMLFISLLKLTYYDFIEEMVTIYMLKVLEYLYVVSSNQFLITNILLSVLHSFLLSLMIEN